MAFDAFLKIEGIDGESQVKGKEKWIEISSWSWGVTQAGGGGGVGPGKAVAQDFHFVHTSDKATPKLLLNCCKGTHIPKATLSVRKAGAKIQDYLVIKMEDILVSSVSPSHGGGEAPADSFSLNFTKIDWT